jgi:hypothetical protein
MSKAFDPLAINPNDFLREPVKDIPTISTGEMIAADQANLAETTPREPPSQMGRAAAIATGAAVGAAAQGRNIMRFSDVPKEFDIKSSAVNTGGMGKPLTKFELMSQPGQQAEIERLKMRDLLDQYRSEAGMSNVTTQSLRTQEEAARRALEMARLGEQNALTRFVTLGGGKTAPESRLDTATRAITAANPPAASLTVPGVTVNYGDMYPSPTGGSAAREISQHESAHYRSLSQGDQMKMVDRLAQELGVGKGYVRMMLEAGEHEPTVTGRVLLAAKDMNVINATQTPEQQIAATMTPAERAAREAEAARLVQQQQAEAARAAQQKLVDDLRFNESDRVLRESQAVRAGAARGATTAGENLLENLSLRGIVSEKNKPFIETQQARMVEKRGALPPFGPAIEMTARALPIAGGVLNTMSAAELMHDAYRRKETGDPIGAFIAGAGATLQIPTILKTSIAGALAGLGIDIGTTAGLYYYDKYAPEIHKFLQKQIGLPKSFDPTNYSVMPGMKGR